MRTNGLLPLTETTYYILLALRAPAHGYQVMQTVEALSGGEVRIAAGTMYGALENLQKQKLIYPVPAPPGADARRKLYALTALGAQTLAEDAARMEHMVNAQRGYYYSATEQ